jgi:hypothetical protein
MKKETQITILLLFLSPILGELLSGSSPPLEFFNPICLLILVLLYGCGTLLIREAKARWKLQWSVIFPAIAYGIIEEGLMVQSFFNPGHADLGALSGYGMYFGVQWPWTIMLILFHATISTLIPIAIVDLLWPEYKDVPLLKRRGLILAFAGISSVTILGMVFMGTQGGNNMIPYHPNPLLLTGSFVVVVLLAWLAYKYKNSRISTYKAFLLPPFVFGIAGFLFQAFNLLMPNKLAETNISAAITLLAQFILVALVLLFVAYQICHQNIAKRHIVSLIFGSILFYILLTPVYEFFGGVSPNPMRGMLAVGIVSLILLIIWRHIVLKKEGSQSVSDDKDY